MILTPTTPTESVALAEGLLRQMRSDGLKNDVWLESDEVGCTVNVDEVTDGLNKAHSTLRGSEKLQPYRYVIIPALVLGLAQMARVPAAAVRWLRR